MKKLVFLIVLTSCWNAEAKELCTLAQTILKPAKNNVCYDGLIAKTKNADDRKWLLNLRDSWKPSPELKLNLITNGYELYSGKNKMGIAQWVTVNPLVLYWNGKFLVGKKSSEKSITKRIQKLFKNKTTAAYLYEAFFPIAAADDEKEKIKALLNSTKIDEEEQIKVLSLFALGDNNNALSAADLATTEDREAKDHLPYLNKDAHIDANCTPENWVRTLQWKYKLDGKEKIAVIQQKGPKEFEMENVVDGQKISVTYQPNDKHIPCIDTFSSEMDEKYCAPAWQEFFKINPKLKEKWATSGTVNLSCSIYKGDIVHEILEVRAEDQETCLQFFKKKFNMHSAQNTVDIKICDDADCTKKVSASQAGGLDSILKLATMEAHIKRFAEGALLLNEVCKDKELSDEIFRTREINLVRPPASRLPVKTDP